MREIDIQTVTDAVAEGVIKANLYLPGSLIGIIDDCEKKESVPIAKSLFADMKKNLEVADKRQIPICQDCGMAVIFAEIGQEVHFKGGLFTDAVNEGIAKGYSEGYLRKSVVGDPLRRVNTQDNTPGIIHISLVKGDGVKLTIAPKGFGSENMSAVKMFNPSASKDDIADFVVQTVKTADARPCPPIVVGVGIGGDFEQCAIASKKALIRASDSPNSDEFYADFEREITEKINKLGIGAQGFGGDITCLCCGIEALPTHIAGLPVAVNIGCHVTRHHTVCL